MRALWQKYPNDTDIGVLYADAMMNIDRWNHWTNDFKPNRNV